MLVLNSLFKVIKEIVPYAFSVLAFFYVFFSTSKHIRILSSMHVCEYMPQRCADLGYVINLSGKKGIGKTTTGAAITNYLIQYIQGKMFSDMDNIRKSLSEVDFYSLEKRYCENLENNEWNHSKAVKLTLQEYNFYTFYTDNFHIYDKKKMLEDYLKRFYILNIRQEYVLSKTYFFDCVNLQNAKQLDPTSLELKNVLIQKNYQLGLGTVIFEDEKQLGGGNVNSNNKQMKTSGKKEQRALIRNAYEGLCFEVTTKQYDADEMKLERKQIDASINIRSRREINYDLSIVRILKFIYSILVFPRKVIYFFHHYDEKMDKFKKSCNHLRRFETWIDDIEKIIKSKGYIIVYARKYFDPDDVGKQNDELYERIRLTLEKDFSYGSVYTYEWKAIAEEYEKYRANEMKKKTSLFDNSEKVEQWKSLMQRGE